MRFARLFLTSFLLLLFLFSIGMSYPMRLLAQSSDGGVGGDNVGPELAFFDPGSQKNVCDKVIRAHNFSGTVAVMNPVAGDPYNPCPGPNTVLRLVQITHTTTVAQMETFAEKLNASGDFNAGTRVVVGVELNNLDEEYWGGGPSQGLAGAARMYAQLFNAFSAKVDHGKYKVYPAPPDLYNAIYDPKPWISAFAGSVDCSRIDALTGDIFDVTPQVPASDNLHAFEYYQQQLCGGSKKVDYFEGWGTDPKATIRKQVEFYVKTPLPSGVERAATLIANTCESSPSLDRKWFYYLQGKVYDKDGNELNLDTCKDGGKANVYVYPGIDSQKTFDDQVKMASTYMMTCASPYAYAGKIENEEAITKPSDSNYTSYNLQCPGGPGDRSCIIPEVSGVLFINHEQTTIPLFRFDKAKVPNPGAYSRRYDDLEGFFGGIYAPLDPTGQNALGIPLGNGSTRKLSSQTLQCQQTLQFLAAIKKACDSPATIPPLINNPSPAPSPSPSPTLGVSPRCALDLRVQSQNMHLDNTYTEILGMYNALPSADQGKVCSEDASGIDKNRLERISKVRSALSVVERTTPKAFKPAYIVRYLNIPQCDPGDATCGGSSIIDKFQNWFSPGGKSKDEKKKNRIIITKVFVPAGFATTPKDTSNTLSSPSTSYTSPFMSTMQAIIPQSEQDRLMKIKRDQASEVENLTRSIGVVPQPAIDAYTPNTSRFVNCPECSGNDLESLFVKRINADLSRQHMGDEYNPDCTQPDLAGETAKERKTLVNPDGNYDPVREIAVTAKATLKAKANPHGPEAQLRTYFFLPEEYKNVSLYEDAFARTFLPQDLQSTLTFADKKITDKDGDQTYRFLQLSDTAPKFGRNGLTVHMSSASQDGAAVGKFITKSVDPDTGKPVTTGKTLNLKGSISGENLDTFNINPQVPGGKLARGLWEIMCRVSRPFAPGKVYAKYPGFEKFLQRGPAACFTDGTTPIKTPPPISTTLSEYFNQLKNVLKIATNPVPPGSCGLTYVSAADAAKFADELRKSLPNQIEPTSGFSGWKRYFQGYYPNQEQHLFGKCGGDPKCYNFILNTVVNTPVCNTDTRLNPYIAIAIALNETGGLRDIPGTNANQHFGCKMASWTKYKDTAPNGLACSVLTANGKRVLNPLLGPPISEADYAACVPPDAPSNRTEIEFDNTVEDGLACMLSRFNAYCKPDNGARNDVSALHAYGYTTMENIIYSVMRYLLLGNTSEYQNFVSRCGI